MRNKETIILLIVAFCVMSLVSVLSYNLGRTDAELRQEIIERHIQNAGDDNAIKFIWNNTADTMLIEGALIKIDFIDENTVYLVPTK
jgi:hypothetical protein